MSHQEHSPSTSYPGLRHTDSAANSSKVDDLSRLRAPRGVMLGVITFVACAAFAYLFVSGATEAEEPSGAPKKEAAAEQKEAPAPQAMPISVAIVPQVDLVRYSEFSGRLRAVEDVSIRPRVSGVIEAVHFTEGDKVEKGALLFTIDQRPFVAAHAAAEAALTSARATLSLAEREIKRARVLLAEKAISQREFDTRQSAFDSAQAAVKTAEANKTLAALDLEFSQVRAPVAGRVGRPDITVGNTVRANQDIMTTLQSIDPVYVDFEIDERTYLGLMKAVRIDGTGSSMPVAMALADEADFTREGRIRSFDNQVIPASGTMRVRAEFSNPDGSLTPGLFARVRLGTPQTVQAIVINDNAVSTDQSKRFVYVVAADGTVQYREVVLGAIHPLGRIVESGLKAGEKIIVNGLLRARPGIKVTPMIVDMTTLKPQTQQP